MNKVLVTIIVVIGVLAVIISQSLFRIDQTQSAIVLMLGKPIKTIKKPGLHFKLPLVQNAIFFDNRLLNYDSSPTEIITKDKKNLVVDNYAQWRIIDPLKLYQTVRNEEGAQSRLDDIIYSELRLELGKFNLDEIVAHVRSKIMASVTQKSNSKAREYGVEVFDVRMKRADLPPENEKAVYGRMQAEREREAKRYRSEGEEASLRIKAEADKKKSILLAEAYKKAQLIMGDSDAKTVKIYSLAFNKDREFYEFNRMLESYKQIFNPQTRLVISPDLDIFKYFNLKSKINH